MVTQTENSDDGLLAHLGMPDLPTALDKAEGSMAQLRAGAREALELFDGLTTEALIVMGLIARAQSLHQGITHAIREQNPHVAFTLLRAYAENAAAISYLGDHPKEVSRFLGDGHPVPIGRITNAASKHFGGFSAVYRTLSEYAHPAWRAVVASHQVLDETEGAARLAWQSAPRFRSRGRRADGVRVGVGADRGARAPAATDSRDPGWRASSRQLTPMPRTPPTVLGPTAAAARAGGPEPPTRCLPD